MRKSNKKNKPILSFQKISLSILLLFLCIFMQGSSTVAEETDVNETVVYTYNQINEVYPASTVSKGLVFSDFSVELKNGKTNIYPLTVKDSATYIIGFTEDTNGAYGIQLVKANGTVVYQDEGILWNSKWYESIKLTKGSYYLKILSKEVDGLDYDLYVKPNKLVVKKTKKISMGSCEMKKLSPNLGKGTFKSSNSNVVAITSQRKDVKNCKIQTKREGRAKVVYTNKNGSKITYEITVTRTSNDPVEKAYFTMGSYGAIKPHIRIANNSDKTIQYVHFTVSFQDKNGVTLKDEYKQNERKNIESYAKCNAWDKTWYTFGSVFYQQDAKTMVIESIKIVYTDKSEVVKNVNIKAGIK